MKYYKWLLLVKSCKRRFKTLGICEQIRTNFSGDIETRHHALVFCLWLDKAGVQSFDWLGVLLHLLFNVPTTIRREAFQQNTFVEFNDIYRDNIILHLKLGCVELQLSEFLLCVLLNFTYLLSNYSSKHVFLIVINIIWIILYYSQWNMFPENLNKVLQDILLTLCDGLKKKDVQCL